MGSIGSSVGGDVGGRTGRMELIVAPTRQRDGHRGVEPAEQIGAGMGDTCRPERDGDGRRLRREPRLQLHGRGLERGRFHTGRLRHGADGDVGAGKRQPEVEPVRELVDAIGG